MTSKRDTINRNQEYLAFLREKQRERDLDREDLEEKLGSAAAEAKLRGPAAEEVSRVLGIDVQNVFDLGLFEHEDKIGEGTFSEVWKVKGPDGKDLVLKEYRLGLSKKDGVKDSKSFFEKLTIFQREFSANRDFSYLKQIPTHYGVVAEKTTKGRTRVYKPAIAMELVESPTLAERIERGQRFTSNEISDILNQSMEVFSHIHHRFSPPTLHRDIKLENIAYQNGDLKILDFGSSTNKLIETLDGTLVGPLREMHPEQELGDASPGTDLYSLGVTLYQTAIGRKLKPREGFSESKLNQTSIDEDLKKKITLLCNYEKGKGPQNVFEFREAFENLGREGLDLVEEVAKSEVVFESLENVPKNYDMIYPSTGLPIDLKRKIENIESIFYSRYSKVEPRRETWHPEFLKELRGALEGLGYEKKSDTHDEYFVRARKDSKLFDVFKIHRGKKDQFFSYMQTKKVGDLEDLFKTENISIGYDTIGFGMFGILGMWIWGVFNAGDMPVEIFNDNFFNFAANKIIGFTSGMFGSIGVDSVYMLSNNRKKNHHKNDSERLKMALQPAPLFEYDRSFEKYHREEHDKALKTVELRIEEGKPGFYEALERTQKHNDEIEMTFRTPVDLLIDDYKKSQKVRFENEFGLLKDSVVNGDIEEGYRLISSLEWRAKEMGMDATLIIDPLRRELKKYKRTNDLELEEELSKLSPEQLMHSAVINGRLYTIDSWDDVDKREDIIRNKLRSVENQLIEGLANSSYILGTLGDYRDYEASEIFFDGDKPSFIKYQLDITGTTKLIGRRTKKLSEVIEDVFGEHLSKLGYNLNQGETAIAVQRYIVNALENKVVKKMKEDGKIE